MRLKNNLLMKKYLFNTLICLIFLKINNAKYAKISIKSAHANIEQPPIKIVVTWVMGMSLSRLRGSL